MFGTIQRKFHPYGSQSTTFILKCSKVTSSERKPSISDLPNVDYLTLALKIEE